MASGSSRERIDQFFASKKKRVLLSPSLKSRLEKDGKATTQGSPSSKASLDNYLATSHDNDKCLRECCWSSAEQVPIKRNLTLEISTSSEHGNQEGISSTKDTSKIFESKGAQRRKSEVCSDVGDTAAQSVTDHGSSELKQFATDFLSLYCSELPSTVSLQSEQNLCPNKRQGSPSTCELENKSSKRRHFTVVGSESDVNNNTTYFIDDHPHHRQADVVPDLGDAISTFSTVVTDNYPAKFQRSLRKCDGATFGVNSSGCNTPFSSATKDIIRGTPKSTSGSSKFSPGDTFWNEAIQVADCLFDPTNHIGSKAEESEALKAHNEINNSNYHKVGGFMSNNVLDGGSNEVSDIAMVSKIVKTGKPGKDVRKEVSPLPVKHFDFALDDKNADECTSARVNILKSCSHRGKGIMCDSVNNKRSQNDDSLSCCGEDQTNGYSIDLEEGNSKQSVSEAKVDFLIQDRDIVSADTSVEKFSNLLANRQSIGENTPLSFAPVEDHLTLSNWLPYEICTIYKKKGIAKLYPWQVDCLQVDGVLQNRNLVYCASTSAGKSFVAEILMLRQVLSTEKMALLVLPYVSICAEKAEHLQALLDPVGKHVRSFYGNQGGGTLPKDTSVAVCTIEKANSLINRLLEEGRLSELGIIVIDELHMVGDQSRGYLLELMLTKLRYAAGEGNVESSGGESSGTSGSKSDSARSLQIVGMSATLPNVAAVADWLQAALYQTEFRPVPLEEFIKVGNTLYNKEMDIVRTVSKTADLGGKDPDHIVELCNEVVQEGHSVLIFCSSRKGCESTARHVAKYIKRFSASVHSHQTEEIDIASAVDALRRSPAGLDPILEETLPAGVAYHHAGLTVEERETVETCYRKGLVRVLTATSTLAAGVNLPARRVIFRQPRIGRDFIDGTRYRQMSGRAGRTGIDTKGESILICKPEEVKRIMTLLKDSCPPLNSCLSEDKNGMTHAILEVVASGIVQTANDIHRYVRCTLLNSTKPFEEVVRSAQDSLRWLCHKKFLEWSEDTKLYTATPLGRAAFGSSLCPEESLVVLDDLTRAREGFVLASDLHLVYLVTPINVEVEPDWELYYKRFMELCALDQSVGNRVGVQEPFLMRMAHGAPVRTSDRSRNSTKGLQEKSNNRSRISNYHTLSDGQVLRVSRRFYVALILSRLVQEVPVTEVCETFKVARGMVQSLQENSGRFASMVSVFCERLGWHDLEGLVAKFQNRVSFGVRAEIAELTTIPYVKGSRARALYKAGLRTAQAIAEASVPEIVKALFESSSWASEGSAQRRIHMGLAKKIKNGARKIVLEKAEEARLAAFSAFKSLGLEISMLAQPPLSTLAGNICQKEARTSSGEESTGNVDVQQTEFIFAVPPLKGSEEVDGFDAKIEEKSTDMSMGNSLKLSSSVSRQGSVRNENSTFMLEESKSLGQTFITPNENLIDAKVSHYLKLTGNVSTACDEPPGHMGLQQLEKDNICTTSDKNTLERGPLCAINAQGGFDSFLDLWDSIPEFFFDIHFNKRSELNSVVPFEIHGMAICWEASPVYYVNVPKDLFWFDNKRNDDLPNVSGKYNVVPPKSLLDMAYERWNRIKAIMGKKDTKKFSWNLKVQVQVLKHPAVSIQRSSSLSIAAKAVGLDLIEGSYHMLSPVHLQYAVDMCIVAWMLWPDEERNSNPNLEKEVKKRLSSEAAAAASRNGRWKNQTRRAAHNGCCWRVAQTRALYSVLWKLLISEELVEALMTTETPLVNVLADMELWGMGVDMDGCLRARHILGRKLKFLEAEAYKLAGMTFSLYTAADIAHVLYGHLKLPVPEGYKNGKQHPSTDKYCLDTLRNEHPIIPVIREHRTLAKLLNCTLGAICSLARLSMRTQKYTLHGHWLQTSTATGRLSMEEPNLQCVEHVIDFKMKSNDDNDGDKDADNYTINARDFFIPTQDNWLLITADYSQIELRLMAHFSRDSSLIELLSKPEGDVFTIIAAKWSEKDEGSVSLQERDQTKRLIYGILYGMGTKTLSEQLECSSDEAAERILSFKRSFPGVASWLQEVVTSCRQKGYVETLKGRKRFLAKIKFGSSREKSKAQRQAVNSVCQGSAADIIKIAMINIHSVIVGDIEELHSTLAFAERLHALKGRCRILLQVHDELVLEAEPSVLNEAAFLLKNAMESAASLLVPLHVKLKVGRTWGSLEPYTANN